MTLFPQFEKKYTKEQYSVKEAQALTHMYSWGPVVFQVARLMIKYGIFEQLSNSNEGLTYKEIVSILRRTAKILDDNNRLYIMETLWDRQKYSPAAFCLTMTSLYFTALANGNRKMYNTDDMTRLINEAGL